MQESLRYLTQLEALEWDAVQDEKNMKRFLPRNLYDLMDLVKTQCDVMEHEGSMMYARIPDAALFEKKTDEILAQYKEGKTWKELLRGMEERGSALDCQEETWRCYVEILLFHEIYIRRCRKMRRDHRLRKNQWDDCNSCLGIKN